MRPLLSLCVLCLAALACNFLSTPDVENPIQPTNLLPTAVAPTLKPQPSQTPAPTAILTSAPLILNDALFEANVKDNCGTDVPINAYENGVFTLGGGKIELMNGQLAVWCYGARHQWIGTIDYEGYIFASDVNDPLQFEIVKDTGYRFVGGIGTLTYPDGKQVPLYRPTKAQEQLSAPVDQIGSLFRDDFTGSLQKGWVWQNENPSRWEITPDGWLNIIGEDQSLLSNGEQSNLVCRDIPAGDVQATVHLFADPAADFQQATLYFFQDGDNFVAVNRGYCSPCDTGGNGIFMEYKEAGNWQSYNVKTNATDLYLRLTRRENVITATYALEPEAWATVGRVTSGLDISQICLGVTNADSSGIKADLSGEFDYLEVSLP